MAKSLQIAFGEDQLTVLGAYYRNELKTAEKHVTSIRQILAKIESRVPTSKRGPKPGASKDTKVVAGKKRGPKPGSKKKKPYTGKKRGPKPKNASVTTV